MGSHPAIPSCFEQLERKYEQLANEIRRIERDLIRILNELRKE